VGIRTTPTDVPAHQFADLIDALEVGSLLDWSVLVCAMRFS